MATIITVVSNPLVTTIITDKAATIIPEDNVITASTKIYVLELDNTANTNTSFFLKAINASSLIISGQHEYQFYAPAGTKVCYYITNGIAASNWSFYGSITSDIGTDQTDALQNVVIKWGHDYQ